MKVSPSDVRTLNARLERVAGSILRDHPRISFKECLKKSSREVPELESNPGPDPGVAETLKNVVDALEDKARWRAIEKLLLTGVLPGSDLLGGFRLRIWGAGSCGLCLAYLFSCHGAKVVLNEKRKAEFSCTRLPNISWKNFKEVLRPVLAPQDFDRLYEGVFKHGGVIDPKSQKLRSSIGAFQEACYEQLDAEVNFNQALQKARLEEATDFDMQVVATGVQAQKVVPPAGLVSFDDAHSKILITTTMYPCDREIGFYREEWEENQLTPCGKVAWRRRNMNVQSVKTFKREIDRFVFNLERKNFPPSSIEKAKSLHRESRVAHVFYFGNDKESYHHNVGSEGYPCLTEEVVVESWMRNKFLHDYPTPTAVLGDATGTSHPLAAIGAYLSFKHSVDLLKYCVLVHNLNNVEHPRKEKLLGQSRDWTESKMALDRLMVFLQARLCYHYSRY